MAPVTQKVPKPTEINNGERQLLYANRAQVGEFCASHDPSRAIIRLIPKAKLNSLPRNHLAVAVVTATISDSAPSPKMSLPAAIIANLPERAVTIDPIKHIKPKMRRALRVPIRSTI